MMNLDNQSGSIQINQDLNHGTAYKKTNMETQNAMAITSLVMGILGLLTFWIYFGLIFGNLGIVFALLSKTEEKFAGCAIVLRSLPWC